MSNFHLRQILCKKKSILSKRRLRFLRDSWLCKNHIKPAARTLASQPLLTPIHQFQRNKKRWARIDSVSGAKRAPHLVLQMQIKDLLFQSNKRDRRRQILLLERKRDHLIQLRLSINQIKKSIRMIKRWFLQMMTKLLPMKLKKLQPQLKAEIECSIEN